MSQERLLDHNCGPSRGHEALADALVVSSRGAVVGAASVIGLLTALSLVAPINGWLLVVQIALVSAGFVLLAPSKDERRAVAWWNSLSEVERKSWLEQGGTGAHIDAWVAYQRCSNTVR